MPLFIENGSISEAHSSVQFLDEYTKNIDNYLDKLVSEVSDPIMTPAVVLPDPNLLDSLEVPDSPVILPDPNLLDSSEVPDSLVVLPDPDLLDSSEVPDSPVILPGSPKSIASAPDSPETLQVGSYYCQTCNVYIKMVNKNKHLASTKHKNKS